VCSGSAYCHAPRNIVLFWIRSITTYDAEAADYDAEAADYDAEAADYDAEAADFSFVNRGA
jgi:hypothetical protein